MLIARDIRDAEMLAQIHAAAFGAEAWTAASIAASLTAGATGYLAASASDAAPQAMALARFAAGECEILTIGVSPLHRRMGMGRGLLQAIITDAQAARVGALLLEVAEDNAAARALYAEFGFQQVGGRPFYYRRRGLGSVDALILRLSVSSPE